MPEDFKRLRTIARTGLDPEDEDFDAQRLEQATAWKPTSDSDYRADAGTKAASTGDLYDPTQNPATRYGAIADNGNNLYNYANRGQQVLNRGMNDYSARDSAAADSRAAADAYSPDGRPTYDAPTYDAPDPFTYGATRPDLETDQDIGGRFSYFNSLLDPGGGLNSQGLDYTPDQVGDYGQAFNSWLTGAQSSLLKALGRETTKLNESAAARGRLRTGFYNEDVGTLQRELAGDFSDRAQMAALDAAGLSLRGAEGNADRGLEAAKLRRSWSQDAYNNRSGVLADAIGRSEYLDGARGGNFEADRSFDYGVYGDARDFGRDTFQDDRNFGYGAFRDSTRDWEADRGFAEDRYRYDEDQADDARDFYADWLSGMTDRRTDMTRYQDAQPSGWEKAVQTALPIAKTAAGIAFPPAGAAMAGAEAAKGFQAADLGAGFGDFGDFAADDGWYQRRFGGGG